MAFLIPLVVLALAYGALQVFPFGKRHILTVDLFHQYAPFLALLRNKILAGSSLFYTGAVGLGTNFYALLAYYLASPLNLILLLFPAAYLTEAIFTISLIKVGLMGLAFYLYLRVSFRRRGALALAFSSFYALSGFVLAYSWNIMWLDTLILLPLVLLALIRLIRDGKWLLYPLFLFLLLASNYYTAFFAVIFIALYSPILLLRYSRDGQIGRRLWILAKAVGLSLLALGLSAVILYPTWKSLALTSASGDKLPAALDLAGRPLAYLGQLFPFLQPTVRSGSPNLYCGLPVLLLTPVFFLSSRIRIREKILNGLLLLFLFLSFDINVLNFLWHGMHYPNQLPHRFSFVAIFLLLTIAYDGLRSTRNFRPTEIGLMALSLALLVPLVAAVEPDIKLAPWTQWGAIILLVLYAILFSSFKSRKYKRRIHVNILLALMIFELVLSTFSGLYYMDRNEYYGNREGYSAGPAIDSMREAVSQLEKMNPPASFYRVESRPHKTSNDPALYGYRGLSLFASTSPEAPVSFFRNLGFYNNGINSYQYRGATLFTEALFGIKYVIAREKPAFLESERRIVLGNDLITVYENPYVFPLAFMVDPKASDYRSSQGDPFKNQNLLARALSGGEIDLYEGLDYDHLEGMSLTGPGRGAAFFHFTEGQGDREEYAISWLAELSAPHYLNLDMRGHEVEKMTLEVNGQELAVDSGKRSVIELGLVSQGQEITLNIRLADTAALTGSFEARMASLKVENLDWLSRSAKEGAIENLRMEEDWLSGDIKARGEGLLLLTIPYDPGWKVYLDGEEVSVQTLDEALIAIPVKEGRHSFFMAYRPVGFHEGLLVSLFSLGLLLLILSGRGLFILINKIKAGQPPSWPLNHFFPGKNDPDEEEDVSLEDLKGEGDESDP